MGDGAGVELGAPPQPQCLAVRCRGVGVGVVGGGADGGGDVIGAQVDQRRRVGSGRAVEADHGVEVHDAARLELGHFGVAQSGVLAEVFDRHASGAGELAAKGDGGAPPQFRGVPLPDDVGGVVVAVPAQRLPDEPVVVGVAAGAGERAAVRADRLVAACPARR